MDSKDFFHAALHCADGAIAKLTPEKAHEKTPCTEWDTSAAANHMVYELLWLPDMLAGKTVAEVGDMYDGDQLKGDPQKAWHEACRRAAEAASAVDPAATVHLSYADMTAENYLRECGADILIHGWDLATGLGEAYEPPAEIAQAAYDYMAPKTESLAASGMFNPPVPVADDAPVFTKLLGLCGYDPADPIK